LITATTFTSSGHGSKTGSHFSSSDGVEFDHPGVDEDVPAGASTAQPKTGQRSPSTVTVAEVEGPDGVQSASAGSSASARLDRHSTTR